MQILKSIFSDYKHSSTVSLIITALILLIVLLPIKSDRVPSTAMPRMEPSKSQALRIAIDFLKQKYDEGLVLSFDTEFVPHEYPDKEIFYLLSDGYNQDYEKLHEKYVFTAPRVVRFKDRDIKTDESMDIYISQAGKVYATVHNSPSQIPSEKISREQATTLAFQSIAQISSADSASFTVANIQHRDTSELSVWNLTLQDNTLALNKEASYGYSIEIRGSNVTKLMPYFQMPTLQEQAIDHNTQIVKSIKIAALVVIFLFFLSGVIQLFIVIKMKIALIKSLLGSLFVMLYIFSDGKYFYESIAFTGIVNGIGLYIFGFFFTLGVLVLISFGSLAVKLKRPENTGLQSTIIAPILLLSVLMVIRLGYRDLHYYLSLSNINNSMFNFLSQISTVLLFLLVAIGFIQYLKYLAARLATISAFGSWYIFIIVLLLSTSLVIASSPLYISQNMYIYITISILSLTAFIYFFSYKHCSSNYTILLGAMSALAFNPSIRYLLNGDTPFRVLGSIEFGLIFYVLLRLENDKSLDFLFRDDK